MAENSSSTASRALIDGRFSIDEHKKQKICSYFSFNFLQRHNIIITLNKKKYTYVVVMTVGDGVIIVCRRGVFSFLSHYERDAADTIGPTKSRRGEDRQNFANSFACIQNT